MTSPFHLLFCFLVIFLTKLSYCIKSSTIDFCPEIEKHSLLTFKQSLGRVNTTQSLYCPPSFISSWDGEVNCCKWEGVVCNNSTGHVSQLHLHLHLHDDPSSYYCNSDSGGKLNESLSNLKHLTYLDLSGNSFLGETIPSFIGSFSDLEYLDLSFTGFEGKIPPHIGNLKHLTYLDLSYNNFSGETIPSFIGSFSDLEYLSLSYSGFEGKIPPHIGNLSNLHTLDLSSNSLLRVYPGDLSVNIYLESENLEWLGGLSKLEYLNMENANLSRAKNWAGAINSLPSLLELHFDSCYIDHFQHHVNNLSTSLTLISVSFNDLGIYHDSDSDSDKSFPIPQWFFQLKSLVSLHLSGNSFSGQIPAIRNATKLQFLDLSGNHLNSTIPDWIYSCKDLRVLDLSDNSIQGQISEAIGNLTSLQNLDLSSNKLSGKLPREITNLCRLQELDLSYNELQGQVEDSFGAMSDCFLGSLKVLDLSNNRLTGHLTEPFGEFKVLESLSFEKNSLSGTLPINLGNCPSLEHLRLNLNKLTGNLPVSLGQLSKMVHFYVHNNQLEGTVKEAHFANLSNLETFSASGNHLTLSVGPNWIPPKNIIRLGLGSWSLGAGPHTPSWLHKRMNIDMLDISDAGISGTIPSWFFDITFLNVSNNNFHGKIPYIYSGNSYMSRNNFSGSLPRIGEKVWILDLSHNTFYEGLSNLLCDSTYQVHRLNRLGLEGNLLSGELPNCWEKQPNLQYLNVGNNTISGRLPNSFGSLQYLESLNLRGNKFTGPIPFSVRNCTNLLKMDLGHNNLDGNVPRWIGTSLEKLKILILPSNKFIGEIPWELCHLQSLQILDLSSNEISGVIPKCLHNLTAMATKRILLHKDMENDVGGPPVQLSFTERATVATKGLELEYTTILSLVTNIDLSNNNLSGEIPKELTRLVMLGSLNLSRNQLSGSIPESIGEMKPLESVDFSRNSLSGQIPNAFTSLFSLSFLDLSFNNLSGRIPQSTQLQTMDASRYMGNDLCGPPLARNCSRDEGEETHGHKGEETEGGKKKGEVELIYVLLSLGYAVGFSGVCSVLVLKKSWRDAYFGLVKKIWDKLYVYFHLWIQRF